jgi:serine/threonine protein kinase
MRNDQPVLGQYRLLKRIGYGGMSEVYYARSLDDESQEVAVKAIRTDLAEDPIITRRFLREVRALSRLSHPHILSLLDWGEEEDRIYLVLPWISDGSLSHLLRERGALPVEQAIPFFGQLCAAVQYTHEHNIIHRDIKPQNVLVQHGDYALLTDFGIAQDPTDTRLTLTGCGMGSVNYMAPEQAMGRATSRSDLYSLGIVLYQLLTGAVPFSAESPLQVMLQQAHAPLPDPRQFQPTLPPELVEILQQALAQNPDARFGSAQDFWEAVQPFQNPAYTPQRSAETALEARPGLRPLTADCPGSSNGLDIMGGLGVEAAHQDTGSALARRTTLKLAPARQKKTAPLTAKAARASSLFQKPSQLTRQQRAVLGGSMAAAFLLLAGVGVLGASQPQQASQHATSASQSAPQPPPRKTAPTPSPSPTPTRPAPPQTGNSSGESQNDQGKQQGNEHGKGKGHHGKKGGKGHHGGDSGND